MCFASLPARSSGARAIATWAAAVILGFSATARAEAPGDAPSAAPFVHVVSPTSSVVLFRVPTPDERARLGRTYRSYGVPVCRAPCDTAVAASPEQRFVVGGAGVTPSEPFALHDRPGDIALSVQPGSLPARRSGAVLTALGGAFTGAGLIVVALGATVLSGGDDTHRGPAWNMYTMAGLVTTGFAVGVLAGGITLLAQNQTEVVFGRPSARVRFEGGAIRF